MKIMDTLSRSVSGKKLDKSSISKTDKSGSIMSSLKEKATNTLSSSGSMGASSLGSIGLGGAKSFQALVVFLDDSTQIFELERKAKGCQLLNQVFEHLELNEREYFGLMFNDTGGVLPAGHSPDVMRWLDPQKQVRKQMRNYGSNNGHPTLYFRVKFYVSGTVLIICN